MKALRVGHLASVGCAAALAVACGTDDEKGSSSQTGGAGGSGGASTGGSGGSGTGGASGSAGSGGGNAGSGGASTGGGGGSGGSGAGGSGGSGGSGGGVKCQVDKGDTICTAKCSEFPITVPLGPKAPPTPLAAVLCHAQSPTDCHLTTNTFSDGPAACSNPLFRMDFNSTKNNFTFFTGNHFKSASSGTLAPVTQHAVSDVPDATEVTLVVNDGPLATPGPNDYKVVLKFEGTKVTMTSVGKI